MYAPHGGKKVRSNFFLSLPAPPARLLYFTKKRFIEALTGSDQDEIARIYREILAEIAAGGGPPAALLQRGKGGRYGKWAKRKHI